MKTAKPKRIRYEPATDVTLARAFLRAARVFEKDPAVTETSQCAGFVMHPYVKGEPRAGSQVFVRFCRFDAALLERDVCSGGLLSYRCGHPDKRPSKEERQLAACLKSLATWIRTDDGELHGTAQSAEDMAVFASAALERYDKAVDRRRDGGKKQKS